MKVLGLLVLMSMITGCDYLNHLKFKYYYSYRGEVACDIVEDSDQTSPMIGRRIQITKLDSAYPEVSLMDEPKVSFNKLFENESGLNLQKLDNQTGKSQIILLAKSKGKIMYTQMEIVADEMVSRTYRANCQ